VNIGSTAALEALLQREPAVALYFTGAGCGVCTALRPRVEALLARRYPRMTWATVDCSRHPEVAAQQGVHAVPTLLVFFAGRETVRKGRSFALTELDQALERPYHLLFSEPPA